MVGKIQVNAKAFNSSNFLNIEVFEYVEIKYVGKFFYWTYKQKETDVSD